MLQRGKFQWLGLCRGSDDDLVSQSALDGFLMLVSGKVQQVKLQLRGIAHQLAFNQKTMFHKCLDRHVCPINSPTPFWCLVKIYSY